MSADLEEALITATELLAKNTGTPERIWHPDFGWMDLKAGEPKEVIAAFYEWLRSQDPNLGRHG